jgi:LysR family transcriptional regulator for metE and metH
MTEARKPGFRLDLRDLRLVHAVVECGTLGQAAGRLHLTQSGASHRLADLEGRLGAQVFLRVGRRLVLTPVGEVLHASALPLLTSLARTEDAVRTAVEVREGLIRLSTDCYTCYHWLPSLVRRFAATHPLVEVRVISGVTGQAVARLKTGDLDVAITSRPTADRRLALTPLFRDEVVAIVAPGHPWAARRFVRAEDFASEHLFTAVPYADSLVAGRLLRPAGVTPRQVSEVQYTEALVEFVKAGLGVAVVAAWAVAPQLDAGVLESVRLTSRGLRRQWVAATRAQVATPDYVKAFVALLARDLHGRLAPNARKRAASSSRQVR